MNYTKKDLQAAIKAEDYALVGKISAALAKATNPASVTPKATKPKVPRKSTPKAAKPVTEPWISQSLPEGSSSRLTEPVGLLDPKKMRFITAGSGEVANLTPEQRKEEREKKKARQGVSRPPAKKIDINCDTCKNPLKVYPSELSRRVDDDGTDNGKIVWFYICPGCIGRTV